MRFLSLARSDALRFDPTGEHPAERTQAAGKTLYNGNNNNPKSSLSRANANKRAIHFAHATLTHSDIGQAQFTPLHLACQQGHNQTARLLLMANAKTEAKNSVSSPDSRLDPIRSQRPIDHCPPPLVCRAVSDFGSDSSRQRRRRRHKTASWNGRPTNRLPSDPFDHPARLSGTPSEGAGRDSALLARWRKAQMHVSL